MVFILPINSVNTASSGETFQSNQVIKASTNGRLTGSGSLFEVSSNVGIGTTSPSARLHVGGSIIATGEITAYFSDARLKSNVTSITNAVNIVMAINGVYYNPNDLAARLTGEDTASNKIGLIAQEVEKVLPQVVRKAPFDISDDGTSKSGENFSTLQYEKLVPLLVEAIKDQQRQLDRQAAEITELRSLISAH